MTDPRTPDFDHYVCTETITSAELTGPTTVTITWSDGRVDRHHPWTLRENATDPATTAAITRERFTDIGTWGDDIEATSIEVDDDLVITWAPDGLVARYDRGWLRNLGRGGFRPDAVRPTRRAWDASAGGPPTFDGTAYLDDDDALAEVLEMVAVHGLVRLRRLPTDHDTVLDVGRRIGVIRPTQFGPHFDVVNRADADSQAYTADRLGLHMDIPTRETPAGLQLLHCMANTATGGESLMADGLALAEYLRTHEPDTFRALTTHRWVWANRSRETDVRWSAPVIVLDDEGAFVETRFVNILRLLPDMAHEHTDEAYRALRRFTQLAETDEFMIAFPFEPGDCVIFDNRRVLHGREAFDTGSGDRHLRGCYVDHDDLWSRLRMLARARRAATQPTAND